MRTSQRTFFDVCRGVRLQSYLETDIPLQDQNTVRQMRLLVTYLDQTCLDLATRYILQPDDLRHAEMSPLDSATIHPIPSHPAWIEPSEPQTLFSGGCFPCVDVAAVFFRAPYSQAVFHRAFVPPVVECVPNPGTRPRQWYQWQLDLIGREGYSLRGYCYSYDQRTGIWRLAEDHTCPWQACTYSASEQGDNSSSGGCARCRATMNSSTRWLATVLHALQSGS